VSARVKSPARRSGETEADKRRASTGTGKNFLERFSESVSCAAASSWAFALAALVVVCWGGSGPLFHFSGTGQLVINPGTPILTFLMVFLIQRSQNKESRAVQLKL